MNSSLGVSDCIGVFDLCVSVDFEGRQLSRIRVAVRIVDSSGRISCAAQIECTSKWFGRGHDEGT
ncbi:MAG: hypothetical protein ABR905_05455 [Terracidiphilus sp.]|jgi:hypothetical protein